MIAKRVVALVLMAMVSTVSPAIYQKGLEPRLGALDAKIVINSFTYDPAKSAKDLLCYQAWITVKNPNPYEVILSQLDLDMFYATTYQRGYDNSSLLRYKKIGSFNTTQEYTVPASAGVDVPEDQWGAIASFDVGYTKIYNEASSWGVVSRTSSDGIPIDQKIFAYVYLSTQFEGNATEEAIAKLLESGSVDVDLEGDLVIGPLKMPFSMHGVQLGLNIWSEIFTLTDVVGAYQETLGGGINTSSVYYILAKIENPSGNPFILRDYRFDLYEEGGTEPIALGIDSRYLDKTSTGALPIFDPDINLTKPGLTKGTRVPLRDIAWGTYENSTQQWTKAVFPAVQFALGQTEQNVIFGLNFSTNPADPSKTKDNLAKFMDRLLGDAAIIDLELKGTAEIALGTTGASGTINGIQVNYGAPGDWESNAVRFTQIPEDMQRITLTQTWFYQKDKLNPQNIQDQMTLGSFQVTKIDVNKNTNQITLNATSTVNFTNPYRIEMNFTEFGSALDHEQTEYPINSTDRFSEGIEHRTIQIKRAYRQMSDPTAEPTANVTVVTTNTTIGYDTDNFDAGSGLGQIYQDIGFWKNGSLQLFNLTNPFRVLGPNGIKLEDEEGAAPNWMELVDYLISNGVDPLMLLHEVNTTGETYTGVDAYMPMACSTFGTDMFTMIGNQIAEPNDMPGTGGSEGDVPNWGKPYHTPYQFRYSTGRTNWSMYWLYDSYARIPWLENGECLKYNNQVVNDWVFAAGYAGDAGLRDRFNAREGSQAWVPDWGYFKGAIWQKDNAINQTSVLIGPCEPTTNARFHPELLKWRFNTQSATYSGQFGYWYDYADAEKGYFIAMNHTDSVLARQNFTLPAWLNNPSLEITKATLSMSYRYPNSEGSGGYSYTDRAILGISNQTLPIAATPAESTFKYMVDRLPTPTGLPGQTDFGNIQGAEFFWGFADPLNRDWQSASEDVTAFVKWRLANMSLGVVNSSKVEVAFGKSAGNWGALMYFDDIILRIEYKNATKLSSITPEELFSYIEEKDNQNGNMWNMMDKLNFNATKFTAFLEGTLGHEVAADTGINFIDFMKQSGAEPETMPQLLENNFSALGSAEPVNFLQMLNQTRYRAAKPQARTDFVDYAGLKNTSYGWRKINLENWVVEDPLKASQVLSDALLHALYTKADGSYLGSGDSASGDEAGEELWCMLENLGVYLPWVSMYLIQRGWSKDDIFDLLEALGVGMEVRDPLQNYDGKASGSLRVKAYLDIHVLMYIDVFIWSGEIGPFAVSDEPIEAQFKLGMGKTLLDPVTNLYWILGDKGKNLDVDGDGTDEISAIPLQVAGAEIPDEDVETYSFSSARASSPIIFVDWVELTPASSIGIKNYTLAIWLQDKGTGSDLVPDSVPAEWPWADYTNVETGGGLTQGGCQQFFQNYRQNVKFQGKTFIQTGGNPVSLFQFLDDAFFTEKNEVDYSSYTLLNHLNAKAIDFIDIITDYNRSVGRFDSLGNGICDEWKAPASRYWESTSTAYDTDLSGFGYNFRDNRIFNASQGLQIGAGVGDYVSNRTGTIIWTDSPDLAYVDQDFLKGQEHLEGNVWVGDWLTQDFFEKGAPPVVNLLDMLSWLSVITGKPDPEQLLNWLTGQLGDEYYDSIGNGNPTPARLSPQYQAVKKGLGYDATWTLFKNITMNATGMVNWMENTRHLRPFKFFYMMNQTDQAMDPLQLLFYAANQNWILNKDGSIAFVYHNDLGTSNANAEDNFWCMLNSTWWTLNDPYGADPMFNLDGPTYATFPHLFYQYLRDLETGGNGAYNLFVMMEALTVDPVSWLNLAQWRYTIKPLELFAVYNTLNYDWAITNRTGGRSRVRVSCNVSLQVNGLNLNANIKSFNWTLGGLELTADYHLNNFLIAANLYRNSYVYYPYSGSF